MQTKPMAGAKAVFLIILLALTPAMEAQLALRTQPLSAALPRLGRFSLTGEYVFTSRHSLNLTLRYQNWNLSESEDTTFRLSGFSVIPEYRYYITNKAPYGVYAAGLLSLTPLQAKEQYRSDPALGIIGAQSTLNLVFFGAGLVAGYQFKIYQDLHLDVQAGFGYFVGDLSAQRTIVRDDGSTVVDVGPGPSIDGPLPKIGIGIGYYFRQIRKPTYTPTTL